MNIKPKQIKKTLHNAIKEVSDKSQDFVKNPKKDFCRNRKLPFEKVVTSVFSMTSKDLKCELMDIFELAPKMPTVSAFVQQRNKISPSAFEAIFRKFTSSFSNDNLYKGFRLIAVDGSDLHTPTNRAEPDSFYHGTIGRRDYNLMHLNALYDLTSRLYVDAIVQSSHKSNEHKAFVSMIDRDISQLPTIYIADRGYESYNNFAHIQEKGQFFLIRMRDVSSNNGIARGLDLPKSDEFDVSLNLNLTRKEYAAKNNPSNLKRISRNATFDYLPLLSENSTVPDTYQLSLRVVRLEISDGIFELLVTNLPSHSFSSLDLKYLYSLRWGIETSFRSLKYTLGLIYFHSKKEENIIQEIFAKLTMYNFSELITSHVVIRRSKRKYPCKVNFSASVHICRAFFSKNISPSSIEALISKYIVPVRPGIPNRRRKKPKTAVCFLYRVA